MKYPWLTGILLVLILCALAVGVWVAWRRTGQNREFVANTVEVLRTEEYRLSRNRVRVGTVVIVAGLLMIGIPAAFLAGAPVKRSAENEVLSSRDIVLCLDASGSMLPYDSEILETFTELVDSFDGERLSLQMWSSQTVVRFPLTDDYALIKEVLSEGADVISRGYLGEYGEYVMVSAELSEYLEGVESTDGSSSASLVGDGLASCVMGFDSRDQERSRTIILATDNEVNGEQIYTLEQAVEFAASQQVQIIVLYPGDGSTESTMPAEGVQLRNTVEAAGGQFYFASSAATVAGIVEQIEADRIDDLESESQVVETDSPGNLLDWMALGVVVLLAGAAWMRS